MHDLQKSQMLCEVPCSQRYHQELLLHSNKRSDLCHTRRLPHRSLWKYPHHTGRHSPPHCSMKSDMLKLHSVALGKCSQCSDLVSDVILNFIMRENHLSSSKAKKIRISRMGSNHNATFLCHADYLIHYHRIACMPAICYICCCDIFDDLFIAAKLICAKALTHVTV